MYPHCVLRISVLGEGHVCPLLEGWVRHFGTPLCKIRRPPVVLHPIFDGITVSFTGRNFQVTRYRGCFLMPDRCI